MREGGREGGRGEQATMQLGAKGNGRREQRASERHKPQGHVWEGASEGIFGGWWMEEEERSVSPGYGGKME